MKNKLKFFKKTDILIILAILVIGTGIWLMNESTQSKTDLIAVILYNNQEIKRINLSESENMTFSLDQNPEIVFEIKDGTIGFIHSDCPDQLCVAAGFLDASGETAVCLPNNVVLKIISDEENDNQPDAVVR